METNFKKKEEKKEKRRVVEMEMGKKNVVFWVWGGYTMWKFLSLISLKKNDVNIT